MSAILEATIDDCRKAIRARIRLNEKLSGEAHSSLDDRHFWSALEGYRTRLRYLLSAMQGGSRSKRQKAKQCLLQSYDAKFMALVRATTRRKKILLPSYFEEQARLLFFSTVYDEPITVSAEPSKPGCHRPIAHSGRMRTSQLLILRDFCSLVVGDNDFDSTVRGAGGEKAVFTSLVEAVERGYCYFVTLDIKHFFPSLRPGHLGGFPFSQWIKENLIFVPPSTKLIFVDGDRNVRITENDILSGNEGGLPKGYMFSLGEIGSKLKTVRQGLPQGDVHAPYIARTVLGREIQLALRNRDIAVGTHLDDVLLGARSRKELETSLKALETHLLGHPAGPLEFHHHEIRHIKDSIEYLGYCADLSGPDGSLHVRPAGKRFDRLRERLIERWRGSGSFNREELRVIGIKYAKSWFRSQSAWTKQGNIGADAFATHSWNYVSQEVDTTLDQFIAHEMEEGIGGWHEDDLAFSEVT